LEVRPQSRPSQVRLQKEIFHAVTDLAPNPLWQHIQEHVERCFGPLAVVIKGMLAYNPYLTQCYIKDFGSHEDERVVLQRLQTLIQQKDIDFYSDIKDWVDQNRRYFEGAIGVSEDLRPTEWPDLHYPRMLCGPKGSGKTTLMLFTKSEIDQRNNYECIYLCLANPAPDVTDAWSAVKIALVHELDNLTLLLAKNHGLSQRDMVIARHERQWRLVDAYPDPNDLPSEADLKRTARDELLRGLSTSKYDVEFIPYLQDTIGFLEKTFGVRLVLMIDDVDRLQSDETARVVCDRARALTTQLGTVAVLVSIREETMAKLSDVSSFATRISIIPPSFSRVLQKRLDVFESDFRLANEAVAKKNGYDSDTAKTFVRHIVASILQTETYANLIAYHYDLDILLGVVRCVIKSPFLQPEYVIKLQERSQRIPWHILLDTMQRFQYKNFYDENSFVLNVFDNDLAPATMSNALIRFRLLQVIRHRFKGLYTPIQLGEIYTDMQELGYGKPAVIAALGALARQRLVVTSRMRNLFVADVRDILPQPTIAYYLNSLVFSYRYLQNVLPVTHVPFDVPMDIVEVAAPVMGEKLKVVSRMLMRFVGFLKECEEAESRGVQNEALFKEVTREEVLSETLEARLRQEIQVMKGF